MNCTEIRENIDLFLHHELEEQVLRAFKRHIRSCRSCAATLEQERQLFAEIRELPHARCPDEVVRKILRKTGLAETKKDRWASVFDVMNNSLFTRTRRLAFSGILLLAVLIVGSIYLANEPDYPAKKVEYKYNEAELRQQKALIEKALAPLFKAVRKSEILTKNEIIRTNLIEPAQKSLLKALKPSRKIGEKP